jgi:small ligand-binding sensory domain FIST
MITMQEHAGLQALREAVEAMRRLQQEYDDASRRGSFRSSPLGTILDEKRAAERKVDALLATIAGAEPAAGTLGQGSLF